MPPLADCCTQHNPHPPLMCVATLVILLLDIGKRVIGEPPQQKIIRLPPRLFVAFCNLFFHRGTRGVSFADYRRPDRCVEGGNGALLSKKEYAHEADYPLP